VSIETGEIEQERVYSETLEFIVTLFLSVPREREY